VDALCFILGSWTAWYVDAGNGMGFVHQYFDHSFDSLVLLTVPLRD
jgi:hypothetical protein